MLINLWQTKEERSDKYKLALLMGATVVQARYMRDWRLSKIERLFGLDQENYRNRKQHDLQLNNHLIAQS